MAVLAAAQLLDELMGRNRNIAPNEKGKELNWEEPEVSCIINNLPISFNKYFVCSIVNIFWLNFVHMIFL